MSHYITWCWSLPGLKTIAKKTVVSWLHCKCEIKTKPGKEKTRDNCTPSDQRNQNLREKQLSCTRYIDCVHWSSIYNRKHKGPPNRKNWDRRHCKKIPRLQGPSRQLSYAKHGDHESSMRKREKETHQGKVWYRRIAKRLVCKDTSRAKCGNIKFICLWRQGSHPAMYANTQKNRVFGCTWLWLVFWDICRYGSEFLGLGSACYIQRKAGRRYWGGRSTSSKRTTLYI